MGLFLFMTGVAGSSREQVTAALRSIVEQHGGELRPGTAESAEDVQTLITGDHDRTLIVYPGMFEWWEDVSRELSSRLQVPTIAFHIHDSDLWMYIAFENGKEVAWFNTVPEYFGPISNEDKLKWQGDAKRLAQLVPGCDAAQIERYLVAHSDEAEPDGKAYPDDEFSFCDDEQLLDFVRRLGFDYPDSPSHPTTRCYELWTKRQLR